MGTLSEFAYTRFPKLKTDGAVKGTRAIVGRATSVRFYRGADNPIDVVLLGASESELEELKEIFTKAGGTVTWYIGYDAAVIESKNLIFEDNEF